MKDGARDPARSEDRHDRGAADDASPRFSAFLRGVTIGALVGAAVAGSALWERAIRRRAAADEAGTGDDGPAS